MRASYVERVDVLKETGSKEANEMTAGQSDRQQTEDGCAEVVRRGSWPLSRRPLEGTYWNPTGQNTGQERSISGAMALAAQLSCSMLPLLRRGSGQMCWVCGSESGRHGEGVQMLTAPGG